MRAQVAELVDALASGASGLTAVEVRVLFWAPSFKRRRIPDAAPLLFPAYQTVRDAFLLEAVSPRFPAV